MDKEVDMSWNIGTARAKQYQNECIRVATHDKAFSVFKQNSILTKIFEHTTILLAEQYLKEIRRDNPWLLKHIHDFAKNDTVGGGQPQTIGDYLISPSTIKYVGVLNRLIKSFGSLEDCNIIEIGGGYGGQCKIIYDIYTPASYTIIDLNEGLQLTKRYLSEFDLDFIAIKPNLEGLPEPNSNWDLCIASYSITEFDTNVQKKYIKRILDCSMMGFIQCNAKFKLPYGQRSEDVSDRKSDFVWSWNLS